MAKKAQQPNPTLTRIEALARLYADARAALAATVSGLNDEIEQVKRKYLPRIKDQVARAKEHGSGLHNAIEGAPELFVKPRTVVVHGLKVGFEKGKGKVTFDSAEKVIELIEKHLADKADVLIITKKRPNKDAIAALEVSELKRIGCAVTGTGDAVVIKDTASDVDKLVAALLAEDAEEVEA